MKETGLLGKSKVVATIMSNVGLFKGLEKLGIGYETTDVGDKYVYENMRANGNLLGGEQSGHVIFGKLATTGDGVLTAIKIMEAMMGSKKTLGELTSDLTIYPQVTKNARVTDKEGALNAPEVVAAADKAREKIHLLLRKSGTEPLLRVTAQGETSELCEACVDDILSAIKSSGYMAE